MQPGGPAPGRRVGVRPQHPALPVVQVHLRPAGRTGLLLHGRQPAGGGSGGPARTGLAGHGMSQLLGQLFGHWLGLQGQLGGQLT